MEQQQTVDIPGDILVIANNRREKSIKILADFDKVEDAATYLRRFTLEKIYKRPDIIFLNADSAEAITLLPGNGGLAEAFEDNDKRAGYYNKVIGHAVLFLDELKRGFTQVIFEPEIEDYEIVMLKPVTLSKKRK